MKKQIPSVLRHLELVSINKPKKIYKGLKGMITIGEWGNEEAICFAIRTDDNMNADDFLDSLIKIATRCKIKINKIRKKYKIPKYNK